MKGKSNALSVALVWGVWFVALTGTLALAVTYTVNAPWGDDWDHAEVLSGVRPVTAQFFWEQHNEHRVPLPKLLWLASLRLSHFNFRALSFVHILLLAGLSAGFILHAKALRGWTNVTDAFLPLLVFNPANYQNVLSPWQIAFVLPTVLAGVLLLLIIRRAASNGVLIWRNVIVAAACLILLPLCGGVGVLFAPVISLWWGYLALRQLRYPESRGIVLLVLAAVGVTLTITAMYPLGLRKPTDIPPTPGLKASIDTALEVLTGGFGYHAGLAYSSLGMIIAFLATATLVGLLWTWWKESDDRVTAAGLLLFFGAGLSIALGIGWSRAGLGEGAGLQPRYVMLVAPILACIYFTWQIRSLQTVGRWVHFALLGLAVFLLPISVREAVGFRQLRVNQFTAFKGDVEKGIPAASIAQRHVLFLDHFANAAAEGAQKMRLLQQAGMDLFIPLDKGSIRYVPLKPEGALDRADEDLIAGWAWDRENPAASVQVDLLDGDSLFDRIDATTFRQDLLDAHVGTGRYSFMYTPPLSLADGSTRRLRVVVTGSSVELPGSPKTVTFSRGGKFLEAPSSQTVGGSLDSASDHAVEGWAWDSEHPNSHVRVEILDGDTVLATVFAVEFRQDLLDANIGRGDHAFAFHWPVQLRDGKAHSIRAVVSGTQVALPGSPKVFTARR